MSLTRNAATIFDEDTAITIMKPFSNAYKGKIMVIYEDQYGEIVTNFEDIEEFRLRYDVDDEEFNELLNKI